MGGSPGEVGFLSAELLELVGTEIRVARGEVVTADFQRWAVSVGDLNPVYFDDGAARSAGYRGIVMPPLFIAHVCEPVLRVEALHPDGSRADDPMLSLPVGARRLMAGGEDIEVLEPVYPGDVLTARCTVTDVGERTGAHGSFLLIDFHWTYDNQDALLVTTTSTSIVVR